MAAEKLGMRIDVTEDQGLFQETTRRFIESKLSVSDGRRLHDEPISYERTWLQACGELGWFAMLVDERDGGGTISGRGLVDLSLIAEEVGRHLQPGPIIPMNLAARALSAHGGERLRTETLPQITSGESVATWAFAGIDGAWDEGSGLQATRCGDGYRLDGSRGYVQDVVGSDHVLVVAALAGRPEHFFVPTDVDGLTVRPLQSLDLTRRFAHLDFDGVELPDDARLAAEDPTRLLEQLLREAAALSCTETVGAMEALFEMTVSYAKDRIAFGRPIGSFQSMKHVLADEAVYLEACRAGAVAVVDAVQADGSDAAELVGVVASYVGERADQLAQVALQIHSGIGFTWEHDLHLFMRRIRTNIALYGEPRWHRERLCSVLGLGRGA